MKEKETSEFSWTGLFLVTSFCFFIFSSFLKFIDNTNPGIFLWIGFIALFLGLISSAGNMLDRKNVE